MGSKNYIIQFLDPESENKFRKSGLKYAFERVDGHNVASFFVTDDIIDYVHSHYDRSAYVVKKTLNF